MRNPARHSNPQRERKSKRHQATRHYQIIRQGDKVLAVIKGEKNDGPLSSSLRAGDFGEVDSLD